MERAIDRFDFYMKSVGLNDNKVTIQLGLTVGLIGKSRKEGRDLSRAVISKILEAYTDINPSWLLTGEGDMLISSQSKGTAESQPAQDTRIIELLKEQNADLQAKVDALNQQIGELKALLKKEAETVGSARASFSANAV